MASDVVLALYIFKLTPGLLSAILGLITATG
jgi:hypothetical protein